MYIIHPLDFFRRLRRRYIQGDGGSTSHAKRLPSVEVQLPGFDDADAGLFPVGRLPIVCHVELRLAILITPLLSAGILPDDREWIMINSPSLSESL